MQTCLQLQISKFTYQYSLHVILRVFSTSYSGSQEQSQKTFAMCRCTWKQSVTIRCPVMVHTNSQEPASSLLQPLEEQHNPSPRVDKEFPQGKGCLGIQVCRRNHSSTAMRNHSCKYRGNGQEPCKQIKHQNGLKYHAGAYGFHFKISESLSQRSNELIPFLF